MKPDVFSLAAAKYFSQKYVLEALMLSHLSYQSKGWPKVMLKHIFMAIIPFGLASPKGGCHRCKGNCGPVLCVQDCAEEAWRAPWLPFDKNPVVVFNMQWLGQLRDLWLSPRARVENKQNGPFLSKANRTKQNMKQPNEKSLKHYSSHLEPN